MRVDLFDFSLPVENIALRPVSPRDSARMLVVGSSGGALEDRSVGGLPQVLRPGDALVFNDTRVIPAQLAGVRVREGTGELPVSATLHMRIGPERWKAFARPGKRIKQGDRVVFGHGGDACLL